MTVKQAQWQLFFLGYYGDTLRDIDGIWGNRSKAATLKFQQEFFEDTIAHDGKFGYSTASKSQEVIDRIQNILQRVEPALVDDGLAGPKTMEVLKQYQESKGLPQTGRVDDTTWDNLMFEGPELPDKEPNPDPGDESTTDTTVVTFWPGIVYFTRDELKCKCGGRYCNGFPAEPQELLMELADRARKHFGVPVHVVSGLRCPTWNALQGGVANSQHRFGEAMDCCADGVTADLLLAFFKKQPEVRYCYKINSTNVHFDIPKGKR